MCGRFVLSLTPNQVKLFFDLFEVPEDFSPRYNIAPTQRVLMVSAENLRAARWAKWGLVPSWAKDPKIGSRMINARAETIAEKPSFRAAFRRRRCLILADGFYEWKKHGKGKTPMFIRRRDQEPFVFAGLWESWRPRAENAQDEEEERTITSCTIITTSPNELLAPIHNRMPVILPKAAYSLWLADEPPKEDLLELLEPAPAEELEAFAVSTLVNSVANDLPGCITPAEDDFELEP